MYCGKEVINDGDTKNWDNGRTGQETGMGKKKVSQISGGMHEGEKD